MIGVPCVRGASIRHVTGPKGAPVMHVQHGTSYRLIVAIDLGKFNSVACLFDPADSGHRFQSLGKTPSSPQGFFPPRAPTHLRFPSSLGIKEKKAAAAPGLCA
jgi:hypothetical protein